jgi:bacterioferritin-associated ferredoxin
MYVCVCHAVTDRTIREAAVGGVRTLEDLAAHTGAGTCCGCCRSLATQILDEVHTPASHAVFSRIVPT